EFSKSQRKLLRKNAQLFTHRVGFRHITQEKELLYHQYATNFNGRLSPTLRDSLEDYDETPVFNTYETTIRDLQTNALVGASYFDLGSHSAASILGLYAPGFEKYSLGYYTMLLEIQYCLQQGFQYYYPGYVVPGYERFDYKLRIGSCHYYDVRTEDWVPFSEFEAKQGPVERQAVALGKLKSALAQADCFSQLCIYPLFEARLYHLWQAEYLSYPYVLLLNGKPVADEVCLLAVFDPHESIYQLIQAQPLEELRYLFSESYLASFPEKGYVRSLLQQDDVLHATDNLSEITYIISKIIAL
ncbi:MAG: arginine-tRNA-protein transferase, partial [Bacteroidota bacterium]